MTTEYFGLTPDGFQKPLYAANNFSDVIDVVASRSNLGAASSDDVMKAANPIGTIIAYYGSTAPYGYLPCSGQTISSSTFPSLVTFLGGTTSATLPDLRGEFLRGWDNGRGIDAGRANNSWQVDLYKSHNHTITDPGHAHNYGAIVNIQSGTGQTVIQGGSNTAGTTSAVATGIGINVSGGVETRPRNVAVLYCIKAYDTPVSATQLNLTSLVTESQLGRTVTSFVNLRSSATGLSALVPITADEITLKTATTQYRTFTNISVSINTAIVGLNGLDTGTLAASTWYSTWVISDGTNVAGLISLSVTSPTLPTGYTYKARTGWARTDSTAKFPLSFIQFGRSIRYRIAAGSNVTSLPLMVSGLQGNPASATPTLVTVAIGNFVPTTASKINLTLAGYCANSSAIAAQNNLYTGVPAGSTQASPLHISLAPTTPTQLSVTGEFIIESPNIYYASSATPCGVTCWGWEDTI